MPDRFFVRGFGAGSSAGLEPEVYCPVYQPSFGQVMRQQFWLALHRVRETILEGGGNPGVQNEPAGLEQRLVGRVLDQGVLEAVGGLGRRAAAEDQLGRDQLVEGGAQLGFRPVGDRGEQLVAELAADHGADLRHLLDRREAVEAGHQRVVQGRRDRERRQRPGQLVAIAGVREQARFQHRLGQLLDEQRHAVGARHDLLDDLRRQRLCRP